METGKILRTKKEINKNKLSGNFGYIGRSNPWVDLDQMWPLGRYGGRNQSRVQYFMTVG